MQSHTARWYFLILLVLGAAVRIAINDIDADSFATGADEGTYIRTTAYLAEHGWGSYPQVVRNYFADKEQWIFPPPLRWGWYAATTLAASVQGKSDGEALANLSTLAGIAAILLTWLLARELVDELAALLAAALCVTSPLQLALGRRALQDELFCAAVLLLFWLLARLARSQTRGHYLAAVAAATLMLAVKESAVFVLPAAVVLYFAIKRRFDRADLALAIAPPALYYFGFSLFARDFGAFFRIARILGSVQSAPYAVAFQSGAPHRLLIDLLALSPIVVVLAIAAIARGEAGRIVTWTLAAILAVFALVSKNVRYIIMADPLMRIAAGALLARRRLTVAVMAIVANAAVEWAIYYAVFVAGDVYDPVTIYLMQALRMAPR